MSFSQQPGLVIEYQQYNIYKDNPAREPRNKTTDLGAIIWQGRQFIMITFNFTLHVK